MRTNTPKWLIAAALLVTIGAVLFAGAMTAYHWDFTRLSTGHFETNTYETSEEFSNIKMNTATGDVLFAASSDDICRVVCCEEEEMKCSVGVQDGTLSVDIIDDRAWYEHIGVILRSPKVTVYLPKDEYASMKIDASTGDIEISNKLQVGRAEISLSTGEIKIRNLSVGTLALSSSTGEMNVSDVTCAGDMTVSTTTGDVNVMNVTCRNFFSTGSTGNVSLKDVIAAENVSVERSTGNVVFDNSDAAEIYVKTSTGNVSGSFLTEKGFVTETSTGKVSVPKTASGGKCEIITSTGDIKFR